MTASLDSTYAEYLAAREQVDNSARNRSVWSQFIDEMGGRGPTLRVLDVGGGIGNTAKRIFDTIGRRDIRSLEYALVDREPENLDAARRRLGGWFQRNGYEITGADSHLNVNGDVEITVQLVERDLFEFAEGCTDAYDVIVAQAFLDLLPLQPALRALKSCGEEGSLWYFPLHYDGVTTFAPAVDPRLDAKIEQLYNESMRRAGGNGGALTGRHLLSDVPTVGGHLLEVGSSDWILFSSKEGYTKDERTLLQAMLGFVENELSSHPSLDADQFSEWLEKRKQQLASNELILVTHQLDVLAEQVT